MFQLARQAQRRHESSNNIRTTSSAHEVAAAGKRAMTDGLAPRGGGTPDFYGIARDSAMRELDAVRHTALPNYVSIRRKANMDPIAKEAELIKAAFQVRYLIDAANRHVRSLEKSETYADPMVKWLRARVEAVAAKALTLGCYDGAMDMRPRRFVDDSKPTSQASIEYKNHAHKKPQHVVAASKDSTLGTSNPKDGNTGARSNPKDGNTVKPVARIARGTSVPAAATKAPVAAPIAKAPSVTPVRTPVQRKSSNHSAPSADVKSVAAKGVASANAALPFASIIQRAFGRHDVSNVRVQIGGAAAKASVQLGAKAYATGNLIAFEQEPDLHTAAHEAAHVIQQQRGVSLDGDVDDGPSNRYERHADEVADAVVAGKSVQHMFDDLGVGSSSTVVQRKSAKAAAPEGVDRYLITHENAVRRTIRGHLLGVHWPAPGLAWLPGGERRFAQLLAQAIERQAADVAAIRALVHPLKLTAPAAHVNDLTVWAPGFGEMLAYQLEIAAIASLERVGPTIGQRGAIDAKTFKIDLLVAKALTSAGVLDSTAPKNAAKPDAGVAATTKAPTLSQLMEADRTIIALLGELRGIAAPFGAPVELLSEASNAVAKRVVETASGDPALLTKYAPVVTFQHAMLVTIKGRLLGVAKELRPIWDDKNHFSVKGRERRDRLVGALNAYLAAAGKSFDRAESSKRLRDQVAAEKAVVNEALAARVADFDAATRGATENRLRANPATSATRERLEAQRRAKLNGTANSGEPR